MKDTPFAADRLLALYDQVADSDDAIPRLRRFVLDLAVRGKLVKQHAGEVVPKNRPKAVKDGAPYDLPGNWLWVRIGDQLELLNGMAFKPTDWKREGLRIVRIQNLNNESAPFNLCDPKDARERSVINDGSFLISWSGTPGTSFGAFIWNRGHAVLNQHIFRCDFKTDAFLPDYLRLAVNGRLDEMIAKAHGGVGLQHITKGKLESMLIALPPLAEQRRIVARVDELMALCDRLEAARAGREAVRDRMTAASLIRLTAAETEAETFPTHARFALQNLPALTARPAQIKTLRQTILNLAVRGKLVEQDPADDPLPKFDEGLSTDVEIPFELPRGWQWSRLCALGVLKGGGTPSKARDDFWDGHIPWVSPKDMKVDYIDAAQMSITDAAVTGSAVNLIEPKSVLFVVRGMILAHSFPVAVSNVPLTINQDMKAIILKKPEMAEYVLQALKGLTPEMLERVQRSSHGTCRIEGRDYNDFLIPVPPSQSSTA